MAPSVFVLLTGTGRHKPGTRKPVPLCKPPRSGSPPGTGAQGEISQPRAACGSRSVPGLEGTAQRAPAGRHQMASRRTTKKRGKAKAEPAVKRPRGCPTKLTQAVSDRLCEIVAGGDFVHWAAAEVGVTEKTLWNWIERGDAYDAAEPGDRVAGDVIFYNFARAFQRARAAGEKLRMQRAEMDGDPTKLARWGLEKINPKKFGPTAKVEHVGAEGGPIQITGARDRLLARLARLTPPEGEGEAGGEPDGA